MARPEGRRTLYSAEDFRLIDDVFSGSMRNFTVDRVGYSGPEPASGKRGPFLANRDGFGRGRLGLVDLFRMDPGSGNNAASDGYGRVLSARFRF